MVSVRVLVVEQTDALREAYSDALSTAGMDVFTAKTVPEAAALFAEHGASIVVLDLLLVSGDAFAFMAGLLGARPETRIIATTASGAMRQAGTAIDLGAFDYVVKPIDSASLLAVVSNAAVDASEARFEDEKPYYSAVFGDNFDNIIKIMPSFSPVLIEGDAGTGKGACAEYLHACSHRSHLPFVSVDCGGTTHTKLAAMFSEEVFENGGTLYLSEVCRLSLSVQTQLLRFLQTGVLETNFGFSSHTNIRVIFCSTINAEDAVDAGRFREDLYYRLKVVRIKLRPLHSRCDEISPLAQQMLNRITHKMQKPQMELAEDAALVLSKVSWDGNISQLQSTLEKSVEASKSSVLKAAMLPNAMLNEYIASTQPQTQQAVRDTNDGAKNTIIEMIRAGWALADLERLIIETAISQNGGSIPKAALQLSVSPSTLYRKKESWN